MNLNQFFVHFSPEYSLLTDYCNNNAYDNSNLGIVTSGDILGIIERVMNIAFGDLFDFAVTKSSSNVFTLNKECIGDD